jgi:hypothetical protein
MEKLGMYKFKILEWWCETNGWYYVIMNDDEKVIRTSEEMFQYEGIARFAAMGHISLLEQGKG